MVMTYSHAKVQGQRSVGSEDKVETNGRMERQTDDRRRRLHYLLPPMQSVKVDDRTCDFWYLRADGCINVQTDRQTRCTHHNTPLPYRVWLKIRHNFLAYFSAFRCKIWRITIPVITVKIWAFHWYRSDRATQSSLSPTRWANTAVHAASVLLYHQYSLPNIYAATTSLPVELPWALRSWTEDGFIWPGLFTRGTSENVRLKGVLQRTLLAIILFQSSDFHAGNGRVKLTDRRMSQWISTTVIVFLFKFPPT